VRAASQASKAADYLLGFIPKSFESASPDSVVGDHEAA
jgi:antirestriction protein ArdC